MKKRRLIAAAAVFVLSLGALTGCVGDSEKKNAKGTGSGETVTLKWISVGNRMPDNYSAWLKQINPYLEEKIGVNLEMEIVPWGDWDNRRSVITNSGEYFDILFTDQTRYNAEVGAGVFLDLTQILENKAPKLHDMIPEEYWKAVSVKEKIYGIPTYKDSSVTQYFIWDKDVAGKYGIDIESIKSYEDLYPALKTIGDDGNKAPYHMSKNGADFLAGYYDQLGAGLPALGVKYDDTSKKVVNPMEDEEILAQLDIVHKMYKEKIINGDAPTADGSNKYRIFFVAQGWSGAAKSTWGPNNSIKNCVAVKFGDTIMSNTSVRGSMNAIYSGSKYPEKALELLQLVNTDTKVRDWLYYGVEGEDFEYVGEEKVKKLNADWSMAGYTQGTFFNVSQLEEDTVNQWDEVKELNENAIPSVMLGFDMDTQDVETELANCRAVYEKYRGEFYTGAKNPRELVKTVQKELEQAGWDVLREEAQRQVDAAK